MSHAGWPGSILAAKRKAEKLSFVTYLLLAAVASTDLHKKDFQNTIKSCFTMSAQDQQKNIFLWMNSIAPR